MIMCLNRQCLMVSFDCCSPCLSHLEVHSASLQFISGVSVNAQKYFLLLCWLDKMTGGHGKEEGQYLSVNM